MPGYVGSPGGLRGLDRTPAVVERLRPVDRHERPAGQEAARGPVEHVVEAVAVGEQQHLEERVVAGDVRQDRNLHRVVVVRVVRRELEVPAQLPGVGVERHHRAGVEVVARPLGPVVVGTRVAGAPVDQVQLRVVRARQPGRGAAVHPGLRVAVGLRVRRARLPGLVTRLARSRNRVEAPDLLAGLGVERRDEPADALIAARGADDDLAVDGQRRQREGVGQRHVRHAGVPELHARRRVDRHHVRVERCHEHLVAEHRHAAVVRPAAGEVVGRRRVAVDPEHASGPGVEGDDVVGPLRQVHHAVDHDGRRLPRPCHGGLVHPLQAEAADVVGGDLVELAVALAEVAARVGQPVLRLVGRSAQPVEGHLRRQGSAQQADQGRPEHRAPDHRS